MFNTKLTILIPAYNEETVIASFLDRCLEVSDLFDDSEILVVNDGSTDSTAKIINSISNLNPRIKLISLATNSGHMAALNAGMHYATGDWIATVDADGQDDPKLIVDMYLKCIENNAEICFTSRTNRKNDSLVHRIFSPLFYKLVSSATKGKTIYQSADFRLISKHVLETINGLPEVNKMFRVLIPNLGFKAVVIEYEREMRIGGSSKYNFRSLFKLGTKSMLATTGAPLRWVSIASLIGAIIALVLSGIALVQGFFLQSVPGWASISFIISVMFFFQSITSLVVSEFLLILLADVRKRPTYQVLK